MAISAVIIGVGVLTIQPLGLSGRGLAVAALLVINSGLQLSRHIPATLIPAGLRFALLAIGAIAAAALLAEATQGTSYLFAFYIAGHAGYRLTTGPAVTIAVATGALGAAVLLFKIGPGHTRISWQVPVAAGFSVLLGMISRSRQDVLQAAIDSAQSAERASQAEAREAVLAERGRIARDVHDVLAHSLAGINMQLELADALLEAGDLDKVRQATRRAQSLVRESLLESQRTVHALREDTLPLLDTLRAMLDSSGHPDSFAVSGTMRDVETRTAQALLRIAQEALTNAARYAPQAAVRLMLRYEPAAITLEILNQPTATMPEATLGSGLGLVGMRERVALLGGTVSAGPVADGPFSGGWRVQAIIPW